MPGHSSPRLSHLPAWTASPSRTRVIQVAACFLAAAALCPLHAQDPEPPPPSNLYTLHVYANLMQFPTVVLDQDLKPIPPVPREKFAITIDGGPIFHPTKMRVEGDDPISLAVLLDAGGDQSGTVQAFSQSLRQLVPGYLHPRDRVSIYALDCALERTLRDEPAVNAEIIATGISTALTAPGLHGKKLKSACKYSLHLWDALTLIAADMDKSTGRRVLLVVSLGRENDSKIKFSVVSDSLSGRAIAVFGLRDPREYVGDVHSMQSMNTMGRGNISIVSGGTDNDLFEEICARNGGMVLNTSPMSVTTSLQHLVDLLRGRYIIEFPRPIDKAPADHIIDIKVAGANAFIRSTGGSYPLPDPAVLADPNTIPTTESPAKIGNRRPKS
jgi:hypothetical protein